MTIRILHVDDEPGAARMTEEYLEREGEEFEVVTETSGADALDRLEADDVDCIVSDYKMREMNGIELLRAVRERWPDDPIPFVLFTGEGSEDIAAEALHAGATSYVQKGNADTYEYLAEWIRRDVTAARAEVRSDREAELRRQNERLEEFASVVSHDLRNPLEVLVSTLALAEETGDQEYFDRCRETIAQMDRLIEGILTLAREGSTVGELEVVDLGYVAERCWANVATDEANLVVETEALIRADEDRLRQVVENLIANAIEHDGENVTVTVGDLADGSGFFVEDDGTGIPEGDREAVFDVGFSTAEDGTGFGLAIVSRIAEAHGWDVRLTESEAGGARFEIGNVEQLE